MPESIPRRSRTRACEPHVNLDLHQTPTARATAEPGHRWPRSVGMRAWQAYLFAPPRFVRRLMRYRPTRASARGGDGPRFATATPLAFNGSDLRRSRSIPAVRTERTPRRGASGAARRARDHLTSTAAGTSRAGPGNGPLRWGWRGWTAVACSAWTTRARGASLPGTTTALDGRGARLSWMNDQGCSPAPWPGRRTPPAGGLVRRPAFAIPGLPCLRTGVCLWPWTGPGATGRVAEQRTTAVSPRFAATDRVAGYTSGDADPRSLRHTPVQAKPGGLPPCYCRRRPRVGGRRPQRHDSADGGGVAPARALRDLFNDWRSWERLLAGGAQGMQQAAAFLDEHAC